MLVFYCEVGVPEVLEQQVGYINDVFVGACSGAELRERLLRAFCASVSLPRVVVFVSTCTM